MSDPFNCRNCGQQIFLSEVKLSIWGNRIPMNFNDGQGGKRGDPHNCKNLVDLNKINDNTICDSCLTTYNREEIPYCPMCYKMECKMCKARFVATRHNISDVIDEVVQVPIVTYEYSLGGIVKSNTVMVERVIHGVVIRNCPECGHDDTDLVFNEEGWRKGFYGKEEMMKFYHKKYFTGKHGLNCPNDCIAPPPKLIYIPYLSRKIEIPPPEVIVEDEWVLTKKVDIAWKLEYDNK